MTIHNDQFSSLHIKSEIVWLVNPGHTAPMPMLLKREHLMYTSLLLPVLPLIQKNFVFSLALQARLKWPQNYFIENFIKRIFLVEMYVLPIKYQCSLLTHRPLGDMAVIWNAIAEDILRRSSSWACRTKLLSAECLKTPLTLSQRWFR